MTKRVYGTQSTYFTLRGLREKIVIDEKLYLKTKINIKNVKNVVDKATRKGQ